MSNIVQYKVLITPLVRQNIYGTEIDITEFVLERSFNKIKKSIDDGDFDIGIYTFSDLSLTLSNVTRIFNSETDSDSIFPFSRDRTKVKVLYFGENGESNLVYEGLINDEATIQDLDDDNVKIRVLSLDSIFRKIDVAGGLINDSNTFSQAIKAVLNRPAITSILNYNANNIKVGFDGNIDDASVFSDNDSRSVLVQLLSASGSVFYVDNNNNMVVSDRAVRNGSATANNSLATNEGLTLLTNNGEILVLNDTAESSSSLELYGAGDLKERNNIVAIRKYNSGLQRTFNNVKVNDTTVIDSVYADRYGVGLKTFNFGFVKSANTAKSIAQYYVDQFKTPKLEAIIEVKSDTVRNAEILEPVSVNYKPLYKAFKNNKIPIEGSTIEGQAIVPHMVNGTTINPNKRWKIIEISFNVNKFTTNLKLREV